MGNKNDFYSKVNELLETTDYPSEIKELSDLEEFLNDVGNQQYNEYDEIERLYDEFINGDLDYEEE